MLFQEVDCTWLNKKIIKHLGTMELNLHTAIKEELKPQAWLNPEMGINKEDILVHLNHTKATPKLHYNQLHSIKIFSLN